MTPGYTDSMSTGDLDAGSILSTLGRPAPRAVKTIAGGADGGPRRGTSDATAVAQPSRRSSPSSLPNTRGTQAKMRAMLYDTGQACNQHRGVIADFLGVLGQRYATRQRRRGWCARQLESLSMTDTRWRHRERPMVQRFPH